MLTAGHTDPAAHLATLVPDAVQALVQVVLAGSGRG
jgi:hypothetical protein